MTPGLAMNPFIYSPFRGQLLAWDGAAYVRLATLDALDLLEDLKLEATVFSLARAEVLERALAERRANLNAGRR
jgi:hypothetical protein